MSFFPKRANAFQLRANGFYRPERANCLPIDEIGVQKKYIVVSDRTYLGETSPSSVRVSVPEFKRDTGNDGVRVGHQQIFLRYDLRQRRSGRKQVDAATCINNIASHMLSIYGHERLIPD